MRLELSALVESDLEAIGDYIAQHNLPRAITFVQEIEAKLYSLSQNPEIYRLHPEIAPDARLATHGRYVILFRILKQEPEGVVRIERILHGGRNFPAMSNG